MEDGKSKFDNLTLFGQAMPQIIHDIRNPLNIVIGFSSVLQMDDSVNDEVKSYLKKIYHCGMAIEKQLVNIDYFAMETSDFDLEPVELKAAIDQYVKENNFFFEDKKISFDYHIPANVKISGSTDLINKLLENLLQFSMKGLKSTKERIVAVNVVQNGSEVQLFYSDSSNKAATQGDFFTYEEVLHAKRGLAPIFLERLMTFSGGSIMYLSDAKWQEKRKDLEKKSPFYQGFCLTFKAG